MVIVIHQSANTRSALEYNEQKVKAAKARFFHHKNTPKINPFVYSREHRLHTLLNIEKHNTRVKKKCLHLSINPTKSDLGKIGQKNLRTEIDNLMERLEYGKQPYFVYKHGDLDRTHFHIVSPRIDAISWKKIKDSYEKDKTRQFILQLEQKYGLNMGARKATQINLLISPKSENLKDTIQGIFHLLNNSKGISTDQEYKDILKALNIEIKPCENGKIVLVNDQDGQPIRHPLNLSEFEEQPKLRLTQMRTTAPLKEEEQLVKSEVQKVLKELYHQYRFFTLQTAREAFLKPNLVLYQSSKNGSFNIYAPEMRLVCDAQFTLKKHFVRLKNFSLTNDELFGIIREYNSTLLQHNDRLSQALIDSEQSNIDQVNGKQKLVLKELNLQLSDTFREITAGLNQRAVADVEMAVRRYYEFSIQKILAREEVKKNLSGQKPGKEFWEKMGMTLIRELMKGSPEENFKNFYRRKKTEETRIYRLRQFPFFDLSKGTKTVTSDKIAI